MTEHIQFFKGAIGGIVAKVESLEHAVRNGVMTYAGLLFGITEIESLYSEACGRYGDYISITTIEDLRLACGTAIANLTSEIKNGTITQVSIVDSLRTIDSMLMDMRR